MPIKYDELMALKSLGQKYAYTDREVMLYAYGIGMGADPMDEKELAFVNEADHASILVDDRQLRDIGRAHAGEDRPQIVLRAHEDGGALAVAADHNIAHGAVTMGMAPSRTRSIAV